VVRIMPTDRRDYIVWLIKRRSGEVLRVEKLEAGEAGSKGSKLAKTDAD
jgi:hypothetical protein